MIWVLVLAALWPPTLPGSGAVTEGGWDSSSSLSRKSDCGRNGRPRSRRRLRHKRTAPARRAMKAASRQYEVQQSIIVGLGAAYPGLQ